MTALRVLMAVRGERGHLPWPLSVCQELERRGGEIAVWCDTDLTATLQVAGLRAAWLAPGLTTGVHSARSVSASRERDLAWWTRYVELGTALALSHQAVESFRAASRQFRPDVICVDPVVFNAAVVAELEGLPWAALSTNRVQLAPPGFTSTMVASHEAAQAARDALFRALGVAPRVIVNEVVSPWLNIVGNTEDYVPRRRTTNQHAFFLGAPSFQAPRGDTAPSFPWNRLEEGRPVVYVSSGGGQSLLFSRDVIERVVAALHPLGVQLVLALQAHMGSGVLEALPKDVIAVPSTPQCELLPRCALMVTHGGANSINECMIAGCPVLVLPLAHDQPLEAHFVEAAGVGRTLNTRSFTVAECREAAESLLGPPPAVREAVQRVGDSFRSLNGPAAAAALIERLGASPSPLRPDGQKPYERGAYPTQTGGLKG